MRNEILLILSLLLVYGSVLLFFKLFKEQGLYSWIVFATIAANIEVLIVIKAFGLEQTLGNIMFASSFLVTDIASEIYGKKAANKSVLIGCLTSALFIVISQIWLWYQPAQSDWAMPSMKAIFSHTPQVMIAGLVAYAISEAFDVWAYHAWWNFTEKKTGDKTKFLWIRNNFSTLISQLINTIIFTFGAFCFTYDIKTLISICISTYVIYIVTSLADTPFLYLAKKINLEKSASKKTT